MEKKFTFQGHTFDNEKQLLAAKKEAEAVEYLRSKTDFGNINTLRKLYDRILDRNMMETVIGIDFLKESRKVRRDIIYFHLDEIIQDHLADKFAPDRGQYKKTIYTDQLVTLLGFTEKEAIEICDSVVDNLGYKYDENYYYIGEE